MDDKFSKIYVTGTNLACFVPWCPYTSERFPQKRFIYLPKNHRKYWFEAVGRDDLNSLISSSRMYVCEDHFRNPSLQIIVEDEVHDEDDDIEEVEEMGETEEIEESEDIEEIEEIETPTSHNSLKRNSIVIDDSETIGSKLYRQSDMNIITETEELDKDSENESKAIAHIIPINRNSAMYVNEKESGKSRGKIAYQFDDPNQLCQVEMAPTPTAGGVTVARIDGTYINKLQPIQQLPKLFKQDNNIIKPGTQITIGGTTKRFVPLVTTNGAIPKLVGTPRFFIKRPLTNKTIREVTMELIEKSTEFHLGVVPDRLTILKTIVCTTAKIPLIDLYITLKKLRLNEDFRLLSEYFEMPEMDIQATFSRTVLKLSKYLKFLIRWPEGKKYYDRHKNMPISFRSKLSYVQSLIECVETEIRKPLYPTLDMIDCKNFKFILTITPSGIISYISEAYVGDTDDLTIFNECNFRNIIPKYLSLVADPGELRTTVGGGIRRRGGRTTINNSSSSKRKDVFDSDSTTDSAEEIEELISSPEPDYKKSTKPTSTVNIVNSHSKSLKGKDISIPTLRVREPTCRLQIRNIIYSLREFKILQPYAIVEPNLYQYINEILVIVSALTNLQRKFICLVLIECVETEIRKPLYPTLDMIDCKNFKFILTITPSGIISYISEAYVGDTDDLTIFNECNFRNIIPKYLSLVADPGELRTTVGGGIRRRGGRTTINNSSSSKRKDVFDSDSTTDSAEEIEELISSPEPDYKKSTKPTSTVNIVNSHSKSLKGKDISIPTLRVREPTCRLQIRNIIYSLREFKILQPYAIVEPNLYQYINEILVIVSALTNLQR